MAVEFKLPDLGENVESADVLDVLVSPGDRVEKEQPVLEAETEKATMEIPSTVAGVVKEIKVSKGDTVKVGQTVLTLDEGEGEADQGGAGEAKGAEKAPETAAKANGEGEAERGEGSGGGGGEVEFKVPDLGENVDSADVLDVLVSEGDRVEKDQPVIEAEMEKGAVEIPSDVSGTVKQVKVGKGDTIKVGQTVLVLEGEAGAEAGEGKAASRKAKPEKAEEKQKPAERERKGGPQPGAPVGPSPDAPQTSLASAPPPRPREDRPPVAAAPSVRQFAREIGVDIHEVEGSGAGGRISIDDVKDFARSRAAGDGAGPGAKGAAGPRTRREKMSKIRSVTARHMTRSWTTIPHVTIHDRADVTDMEAMRQRFKKKAEEAGGKLTITAIFVKIVATAVRSFPAVNALIDVEAGEIEYRNYSNIGVAVDTPRGLVVPVIRDAERKSIFAIARELTEISGKAREGKLSPDDMSGGTFTITNLGSIGTGFFTPIVNHPEVAILGMGRAVKEPVWKGEQFVPRLLAPLSLSFDHRLVDGADGARFLRWVVEAVENPLLLSFES